MNCYQEEQVRRVFEAVARENGVSVNDVREEIQKSIVEAMSNTDLKVQSIWKEISSDGHMPTPEEYLIYVVQRLKK